MCSGVWSAALLTVGGSRLRRVLYLMGKLIDIMLKEVHINTGSRGIVEM